MSKKVLITGANGQDGTYLIEYLLAYHQDIEIIYASRRTSYTEDDREASQKNFGPNSKIQYITLDLMDGIAIRQTIEEIRPDYFINFGAQTFVADSWKHPVQHMQVNAIALIYILEAVREFCPKCRVYSAGSSEQFGDVKYSPQDEKHPMSPRSIYGVSKVAADFICKVYRESYGLYVVHAKLFNHESPRRGKQFVTGKIVHGAVDILKKVISGQEFKPIELGNIYAQRDWSHAWDFVKAVWLMVNQDVPKDYVLSSNETHTVKEFVDKTFKLLNIQCAWHGNGINEELSVTQEYADKNNLKSSVLVKINPEFYRPAEVELLHGDSSLARKELGWTPDFSFDDLIFNMVESELICANLKILLKQAE